MSKEARQYWVIGGIYRSTDFKELADGASEERIGPFDDYRDALKEWQGRAQRTVDICHARYRIVEEPAHTANARA